MERTAIIYSFNTVKTAKIALYLKESFGSDIEMVNAETLNAEIFLSYNNLILGVATWFDGELPNYWDEFVPELEDMDLTGKKIALFGLGDQKNYGENFVDGIGILGRILEERGAALVGFTSTEGYSFENSQGIKDGRFMGLAIDYENQASKNKERISNWVEQLRGEMSVRP